MQHPEGMRMCPTRTDGESSLIAHQITVPQCQKRQREHFHKCPTCAHYNPRALAAPSLLPSGVERPQPPSRPA